MKYSEEELKIAINSSFSWRETLSKLGVFGNEDNRNKARDRANQFRISFSHFLGKASWKGKDNPFLSKDPKYLLILSDKGTKSHYLKMRLIRYGYKKHQCEKCQATSWQGQELPIELHHINGNKKDNRLENLQILCPNCHAQTPNYTAKNKKSASLS
jgi:hypothetical protein